jgi:hypothetical protein
MKTAHVIQDVPEIPGFYFVTTGPMGGDAGHGAEAVLEIQFPSTGAVVDLSNSEERFPDACFDTIDTLNSTLRITVFGDWEIGGLEDGLIELGRQLAAKKAGART